MKKGEGRGLGFASTLTIVLIALKLAGVINCSWLLVFAPIILDILLVIIVLWWVMS